MLGGLQVGRGIAALLVVFHHATLGSDKFYGSPFNRFFEFGYIGVDFFFVLSGFIIFYIHQHDQAGFNSWNVYIKKRIIRVFTPYLLISVTLLIAYNYAGFANRDLDDISILSSLFLIPTNGSPALTVAWTLIHEMIFYSLFSVYFVSRKLFAAIACVWVCIIISVAISGIETSRFVNYFISFHNLEFLFGLSIAWFITNKKQDTINPVIFLIAGISMFLFFVVNSNHEIIFLAENLKILYLAICFTTLVLWLSLIDLKHNYSYPQILQYIGAASYSIYLVHNPVISVLNRLFIGVNWITPETIFVIISVLATLSGVLYFQIFEKNALKAVRRLTA